MSTSTSPYLILQLRDDLTPVVPLEDELRILHDFPPPPEMLLPPWAHPPSPPHSPSPSPAFLMPDGIPSPEVEGDAPSSEDDNSSSSSSSSWDESIITSEDEPPIAPVAPAEPIVLFSTAAGHEFVVSDPGKYTMARVFMTVWMDPRVSEHVLRLGGVLNPFGVGFPARLLQTFDLASQLWEFMPSGLQRVWNTFVEGRAACALELIIYTMEIVEDATAPPQSGHTRRRTTAPKPERRVRPRWY